MLSLGNTALALSAKLLKATFCLSRVFWGQISIEIHWFLEEGVDDEVDATFWRKVAVAKLWEISYGVVLTAITFTYFFFFLRHCLFCVHIFS